MNEQLKIGIIGSGEITRILLPMMNRHDIRPLCITDLNSEAANRISIEYPEISVCPDADALLNYPDIEAVYVATPPSSHFNLFKKVIEANLHLIGEKPWVLNYEEAIELEALAESNKHLVVSSCATRCLFNDGVQHLRKLLENNSLGKIRFVKVISDIGVPRAFEILPKWKTTRGATPGGVSADWAVYELEWLRSVLGDSFRPIDVQAVFDYWNREGTPFDSSYQFTLRCPNDLTVLITRTSQIGPQESKVQIRGDKGGVDLPLTPNASNKSLFHYTAGSEFPFNSHEVKNASGNWEDNLIGPFIDAHRAIRSKSEPIANASSQVIIHSILDALYESAKSNSFVKIKDRVEAVFN